MKNFTLKRFLSLLIISTMIFSSFGQATIFADEGYKWVVEPTYEYTDKTKLDIYKGFVILFKHSEELEKTLFGAIDKTGKVVVPFTYKSSEIEQAVDDYIKANKLDTTAKKDKIFVDRYTDTPSKVFSDGLTIVPKDKKRGIMDKNGKMIVPFKYEYIEYLWDDLFIVAEDFTFGIINKKGETIIPIQFDDMTYLSDDLLVASKDYQIGILRLTNTTPKVVTQKATPTSSKVIVNGKEVSFDAYTIDGNNYFKLRDIAKSLNNTEKQFDVSWDAEANLIELLSNKSYTITGGEMVKGDGATKIPTLNKNQIMLDGQEVQLTAYTINSNNYFKLRDLGQTFDFSLEWDETTNTINMDTSNAYTE